MRMKPIAVVFAVFVLIIRFVIGDYDQADSKLNFFYAQMLVADFSGAHRSIDEAILLWPGNARYYAWRGYSFSQQLPAQCPRCSGSALGAVDQHVAQEAIANYRRALGLNSRDAVAHHNLAWLEHLLGDDDAAARDWREATFIDPNNPVLHLSYGMFLEESGNVQAGRDQIEAAINLSPSIIDSPFFLRYRKLSPDAADSIISHCVAKLQGELRTGKDPILQARLGKLYLYSRNFPRSIELLQDAAEQLPNLALVWFNLGEAYANLGDNGRAIDCYKKANFIDGSLAGPYLRLGQLYLQAGQKHLESSNLRLAAEKWEHRTPITASHNNRLYNGPRQRIDDLLPTTLVWYVTPCEVSEAYRGLAELAPPTQRVRYLSRINTCEQIPAPHLCPRENL